MLNGRGNYPLTWVTGCAKIKHKLKHRHKLRSEIMATDNKLDPQSEITRLNDHIKQLEKIANFVLLKQFDLTVNDEDHVYLCKRCDKWRIADTDDYEGLSKIPASK